MRYPLAAFLLTAILACARPETPATTGTVDPVIAEFLQASAATDFHTHGPRPARFRQVRVGRDKVASGQWQYVLCGEVLPVPGSGKADWTPFVTIKTSGYEQYIGAQAVATYCGDKVEWNRVDLSASLQARVDSLAKASS